MQIIAGKYKNKKITTFKDFKDRPTIGRVKENVFNLLSFEDFKDIVILDLFCGTGSIGLEFLSRGASKVYFNDKDKQAILNLNKFIKSLNDNDLNTEVFNLDYKELLLKLKDQNITHIYLDPPYNFDYNKIIKYIDMCNFNTTIIIESNNRINIDAKRVIKEKKYSSIYITIIK